MAEKRGAKKRIGRPRKEIDIETAKKMFQIFCTGEDVAYCLNVSYDTLEKRIKEQTKMSLSDFIKKAQSIGKTSLRQKQYQIALAGNVTMLIWLGKQYLGQAEKSETTINNELEFEISYD